MLDRNIRRLLLRGAQSDDFQARNAVFAKNHQLLREMYVVKFREKQRMQGQWDIFELIRALSGPDNPLTLIQPSIQENPCVLTS